MFVQSTVAFMKQIRYFCWTVKEVNAGIFHSTTTFSKQSNANSAKEVCIANCHVGGQGANKKRKMSSDPPSIDRVS